MNTAIQSNYNKEIWSPEQTFVSPCKCKYCGEKFKGRFVEAVHETIECPKCGRTLSWSER